jgi:hypothetical protein
MYVPRAPDVKSPPPGMASSDSSSIWILCAGAVLIILWQLVPIISRYSTAILASTPKHIFLNESLRRSLIDHHSFLLIGGPHRGGTTILWRLLASHPQISGFPETGVPTDFAEGSFLQSVLPTFGVGAELLGAVPKMDHGLGRYAFASKAHMTEEHPLNTNASSLRLLSEWAANWNLTRPVLLEKTPTDSMRSDRAIEPLERN